MKKLLSVLIASLLILSFCSCGNPSKKAVDTDEPAMSEDVVKENIQENEDVKKQPDSFDNAEILDELDGYFMTKKYVDTFKETKSLIEASEYGFAVFAHKDENGSFSVSLSDLHQAGPIFSNIESIVYDNEKYIITILPKYTMEKGILEMIYTPGSDTVQFKVSGNSMWSGCLRDDMQFDFYKYDSVDEAVNDIATAVFSDIESVKVKDDGAYTSVDGAEYHVKVLLDEVITEPIEYMDVCDGYILLNPVGSEDYKFGQYAYDDGKLTIAAEGLNLVLE